MVQNSGTRSLKIGTGINFLLNKLGIKTCGIMPPQKKNKRSWKNIIIFLLYYVNVLYVLKVEKIVFFSKGAPFWTQNWRPCKYIYKKIKAQRVFLKFRVFKYSKFFNLGILSGGTIVGKKFLLVHFFWTHFQSK
jgi:hypothetical protein